MKFVAKRSLYCSLKIKNTCNQSDYKCLLLGFVEITGLEPVTSTLPVSRSSQMS